MKTKKYLTLLFLLCSLGVINAQIVDNKFTLYAGYSYGNFATSETIDEDGYISPSLYGNFERLQGVYVKGLNKSSNHNNLSFGFSYNYGFASKWYNQNYDDFLDADISMHTLKILSQVHTRYHEKGLWNRIRIYFEGAASFGYAQLALSNPVFTIQQDTTNIAAPASENKPFAGLSLETGMDIFLPKNMGIFIACSGGIYWINSKFYNDNYFSPMTIRAGILFRLSKNKRFYY